MSHFLEHMFFKGTRRRSAIQISREIDALGGEMNAFTTRETTTFYVKVLDQQLETALELLSDLFYHSRFDSREVEKEKKVVLEEIKMVQDDPEDLVQELHMRHTLKNHPLGRPILGEETRIQNLNRQDLLKYVRAHYDPRQTVIAVAGNFSWKRLEQLLLRFFGDTQVMTGVTPQRWPPEVTPGLLVQKKPLEQVHLCLGLKGIAAGHKDRYAAHALNGVLGGSVSSRLFQEVREKTGVGLFDLFLSFHVFGWRHDLNLRGDEAEGSAPGDRPRASRTEADANAWSGCERFGSCEESNEGQSDAQSGKFTQPNE